MSRYRFTLVAALVPALVALALLVVPTALAQTSGSISIGSAEVDEQGATVIRINVTGKGQCGTAGTAIVQVTAQDTTTGTSSSGAVGLRCDTPGEHVAWTCTQTFGLNWMVGDRVLVTATATGAIVDTDSKEVVIQQYH